jgi:hypothetical protein
MAQSTVPITDLPSAQFRIGSVLSKTSSVFFRRPLTFVLITFSAWAPLLFIGVLIGVLSGMGYITFDFDPAPGQAPFRPEDAPVVIVLGFLALLAIVFFGALSSAIILHLAFQDIRRRPVRLREAIARGFSRFLPLVGVILLAFLGTMFGFILVVIPGLMLITMWTVAGPACIFEQLGPVRSLERSRSLTKGFRWKLFWLFTLFVLANVALSIVQKVGGLFLGAAAIFATEIVKFILISYYNVGTAVAYHDLRVAKEGVDIEGVAAVFD